MLRVANRLTAKNAQDLAIVASLADDYYSLVQAAVEEVRRMEGAVERIPDAPVKIPDLSVIKDPMAGNLPLSNEVVGIITQAIPSAARASSFEDALEIGYGAFGDVSCTDAAKEGISAFMEKRPPQFKN